MFAAIAAIIFEAFAPLLVCEPWHAAQLFDHAVFPSEPVEGVGVGFGGGGGVGVPGVGVGVGEPGVGVDVTPVPPAVVTTAPVVEVLATVEPVSVAPVFVDDPAAPVAGSVGPAPQAVNSNAEEISVANSTLAGPIFFLPIIRIPKIPYK